MGVTSATGVGSGIDINSIVSQLVKSEGQPAFNAITRQEDAANARLSGLGSLKSALSSFKSSLSGLANGSVFKTHTASSSDEAIVKVTAGTGSVAGSHSVQVTQLATAQQSITNAEFASSAATVGTGTLTITNTAGAAFSVTVDASNNTLAGIRDAINASSSNSAVTASIINVDAADGSGTTVSKLVLTADSTGLSNAFTISGSDTDGDNTNASGLSQLFTAGSSGYASPVAAANAQILVDGQTATRSTNSMTDVLPGLTLDLQKAVVGTSVTVGVTLDTASISKTISGFVTAYNALHTSAASLGSYGGTAKGATNGALLGDATLRYVNSQLRTNTTGTVSSATSDYNSLAMIGVSVDQYGVMSLDSSKLTTALTSNLESVSDVFSSSDGVATRLSSVLTEMLASGGPIDAQQTSLNSTISGFAAKREAIQLRLDNLQKAMQKQFIAMDVAVAKFQNTGTYLTNALKKA